jgi:hypothetical protein
MSGEHQESGCNQVLASPSSACEPATSDGPGAFGADIVASLSQLPQMIDEPLQFGPFGCEQGFALEGGGEDLVFS